MRVVSLLSVTVPTIDPEASRRWWGETLGVVEAEDDPSAIAVGDTLVEFGPDPAVRVVAFDLEDGPGRFTDPGGTVVDVVAPDVEEGRRIEATISEFIASADELAGPAVTDLTGDVLAVVVAARDRIGELIRGVPHNKVLAAQLELSQRARAAAPSDDQWPMHAASTLMSGFIIAGAGG
jgi:hypothetical protein